MNRFKTVFLFNLIFLLACNASKKQQATLRAVESFNEAANLTEKYTVDDQNRRQGWCEGYTPEGKLFEKAFYKNDTLDGERILYYDNGKKESIEHYKNGIHEGIYQHFYENGVLQMEGLYRNDKMCCEWKAYYPTSELKEIVTFKNNEENGPFTEYYKNGTLKTRGNYLNGDNEDGLLEMFDESGKLIKKMTCVKGICRTIRK